MHGAPAQPQKCPMMGPTGCTRASAYGFAHAASSRVHTNRKHFACSEMDGIPHAHPQQSSVHGMLRAYTVCTHAHTHTQRAGGGFAQMLPGICSDAAEGGLQCTCPVPIWLRTCPLEAIQGDMEIGAHCSNGERGKRRGQRMKGQGDASQSFMYCYYFFLSVGSG